MKPEQIEKYRISDETILKLLDVSKERKYSDKKGWEFTTTVDIYPIIDEQIKALLSHLKTEGELGLTKSEIAKECEVTETFIETYFPVFIKKLIKAQLSKLSPHLARVKELEAELERIKSKTWCAYCGQEYPLDTVTAEQIGEHINTCEKHPLFQAKKLLEAKDKEVSQAVQAERDRIWDYLFEMLKFRLPERDIQTARRIVFDQALQK